jgi:hypothetical protein
MSVGEFKLAKQIGPKGFFGKVVIEVEPTESNGAVAVEFDADHANRWTTGAEFGIDYVLEHIAKRKVFPNGGRIRVSRIDGHEVDTNSVVIAYVAAHALLNALGASPAKQPGFDEGTGHFFFPK